MTVDSSLIDIDSAMNVTFSPDDPFLVSLLSRCSFGPGSGPGPAWFETGGANRIECAVSGGADSAALLVLAVAAGLSPTAVYVDHGLRESSARDGDRVARLAAALGASFVCRKVSIAPGENLEARARAERYAALAPNVLTGHTADDLAETIVYNLMRGAGIDGLTPFRAQPGRPQRPILGLRRRDTEALCAHIGYEPVVDSMNTDVSYARVRVRKEVLPLMNDVAQRDVASVISRQWPLMLEDALYLSVLAAELDSTDAVAVATAPLPLARRAVRRWLAREGVTGDHPPDQRTVERVLEVARNDAQANDLVHGWRVLRTNQRLRLERTEPSLANEDDA